MIEVVYSGEEHEEQDEVRIPKNIHQIGNNSSNKKIYIEDYVMTYLKKSPSGEDNVKYGVLLGDVKRAKGNVYIFVKGMVEVRDVIENSIIFNDDIWSGIYKDIKQFFEQLNIVGWYVSVPYRVTEDMNGIRKIHLDNFAGNDKVCFVKDRAENEEGFYSYEQSGLGKQQGYYIYYEKNEKMKKLKIFPKMFIQIFSVLGIIIILVHSLVFFIFPKTYLETRKEEVYNKANEISSIMNGKEIKYIEQTLELYSKSSEIKAFIKEENNKNEIQIKDNINVSLESDSNSLIIEEREIKLNDGKKTYLQFVSTADMQKDAKDLSLKFLPYSLLISILFSSIISLIYAKLIKNNIQEIQIVTDKMMKLDKKIRLEVSSNDEVGELKQQINDLYSTLLRTIDDLEFKNKEILKLEKLKYDFFKGASHELKTPLASLKIILENMKYNIGKYKEKDIYINECIEIVDSLTKNISQILSVHSIENLNNDEEYLKINDTLEDILKKYEILANQKKITVNNYILDENIYIGKTALKIILSNLISNAVKYTDVNGVINIGIVNDWLYIENSYGNNKISNMDKIFDVKFDLNKENSNGLGLYIVSNILNNYNIEYKALQDEEFFIFKIKIFS